jgi:hypothetical protein
MITFVISEKSKKIVANAVVSLIRKSDVLLTPKTIDASLPPNVPASPPPFDDCISTMNIKSMATRIIKTIKTATI